MPEASWPPFRAELRPDGVFQLLEFDGHYVTIIAQQEVPDVPPEDAAIVIYRDDGAVVAELSVPARGDSYELRA